MFGLVSLDTSKDWFLHFVSKCIFFFYYMKHLFFVSTSQGFPQKRAKNILWIANLEIRWSSNMVPSVAYYCYYFLLPHLSCIVVDSYCYFLPTQCLMGTECSVSFAQLSELNTEQLRGKYNHRSENIITLIVLILLQKELLLFRRLVAGN